MSWKEKLLSGRYFLTVCAGITFTFCAIAKILTPEVVGVILVSIFKDYFSRQDRKKEEQ